MAKQLSNIRRDAADRLSIAIESELTPASDGTNNISCKLQRNSADGDSYRLFADGIDEAAFLIAPNPGEPLKPLNKIASGGEMSRIMLALKTIFASIDLCTGSCL